MSPPGPVPSPLQIASAIVTDRRLRRQAMAIAVLTAATQCFVGTILLPSSLTRSPLFFLLFWGSCLFFVLIAIGLAVLDVLKLREQLASELRSLRKDLHSRSSKDDSEANAN